MNSYDSQRMSDLLIAAGYQKASSKNDANLIVFNTCSIRAKADQKLFSDLGRARALKENSSEDFLIVVTGCIAQTQSKYIQKRMPYVDMILGPQDIQHIAEKVSDAFKKPIVTSTTLDAASKFLCLQQDIGERGVSEFLTIQEGCNNFCTYCVVPHTRGREFSRDAQDIINEAKQLTSRGTKEITLLGQNVSSYGGLGLDGKTWSLARLIYELAELNGLKRVRYTTSHPKDINIEIALAHKNVDILMPYLHLPIQSGSDRILASMNRKYSVMEYKQCIDLLRTHRPDMVFSSDFIVGFPGESEEDFQQTMQIANDVKYAQAYSFKYSRRPNTFAAQMENQVAERVKSDRLHKLQDLLNEHQSEFNKNSVGSYMNVLFTKKGRHKNQLVGRGEYSQSISACDTDAQIGDICKVRITDVASHSLIGVVDK